MVGAAKRAITPQVETTEDLDGDGRINAVWIAGFGSGRQAEGVHDDIWTRVVTLEQGELRVALVALDLVGYFNDEVVRIREAAKGMDFDHILVASTHQHEGPDTMGPWGQDAFTSGIDPDYMDRIVAQTVEALQESLRNAKPAQLRVAQTERAAHLIGDSRLPEVIDPALTALLFEAEGAPLCSMVIYGNHPEALGGSNKLLSSDYPHYLREALEARYGATSVFFSGSLGGLMNPLGIPGCPNAQGEATCKNGEFEKAKYIGDSAAQAAIEALEQDAQLIEAPR